MLLTGSVPLGFVGIQSFCVLQGNVNVSALRNISACLDVLPDDFVNMLLYLARYSAVSISSICYVALCSNPSVLP